MIVPAFDKARSGNEKGKNGRDFQQHHYVVGLGRFANSAHQHNGNDHHDQECRDVEAEMPSRLINKISGQIRQSRWEKGWRDPARRRMHPEPVQQIDHVRRKADTHGNVAHRVFQYQVPANDPGNQLTHGCVGVGVCAACDGNHRRQFGITKRCEGTDNRHQDQ